MELKSEVNNVHGSVSYEAKQGMNEIASFIRNKDVGDIDDELMSELMSHLDHYKNILQSLSDRHGE